MGDKMTFPFLDSGKPDNVTVIKVKRNYYRNKKKEFVLETKLTIQRRSSSGHQLIEEDCDNTSCQDVIDRIRNLNDMPDGLYHLITVNLSHDFESGYLDDWDYKLIHIQGENE